MEIIKITVGQLQTNCYLLISDGEVAVIDPGDEAQKIIDETVKTRAAIKSIIVTHNHFDHVGALKELEKKFAITAIIPKAGQNIVIGAEKLKVVATPGHTAESICLFGGGFVVSGDTLFSDGFGRTDLEGGSNKDMAGSLKKLDELIPEGAAVYPGHGRDFIYRKGMATAWLDYLM